MAAIEIKGLDAAITRLGKVKGLRHLKAPMERSVERVRGGLARYPRQRAGTYRRTGTLGRRWTAEVRAAAGSLVGVVGNVTAYGPYVQSATRQAGMHRGLWQTDEAVAQRETAAIRADFEQEIARLLG